MNSGISLTEDLEKLKSLTETIKNLFEEEMTEAEGDGYRYPFRHKANLGMGPRGRHHNQARQWSCKHCGKTKDSDDHEATYCDCKGIGDNEGHHKRVVINHKYKTDYDKEYKHGKYPHWAQRRDGRKHRLKASAS